jgi:hypothetical protein
MAWTIEERLAILRERYLTPRGWDRPLEEGPVDAQGRPLPWITYAAQEVLSQIVRPNFRVFEFGCGNSSLWWADRVKEVVSIDHDPEWLQRVGQNKPDNLSLLYRPQGASHAEVPGHILAGIGKLAALQPVSPDEKHNVIHGFNLPDFIGYATTLLEWPQHHFDIIVVDGMARSLCAYLAGLWVKPHGIVVYDNSERWQYSVGFEMLRDMGFGRIDFFSAGPVNCYESCTSLFVKSLMPFLTIAPREKRPSDLHW